MKKIKLLLAAAALLLGGSVSAQMTDVTDTYITNAGFETDAAASDLTGGSTQNTPTGWTISPSSLSNTQWGTAKSDTKIQGNSTSQAPSAGTNYFYFRDNWNSGTNIKVSQASKAEVPAGNYIVYVDVFTYSSNATQPVYTFTVGDGSTTYVNGSITANKKAWATYYYHFKLDNAATLTFSANMTPKAAASNKHDWMLLDNIRLLKADNPAEPVANNTTDLYLLNEATGQYLAAGQSWGTRSIVNSYGQEVTATLSNGLYSLKTQQYNNKYLGSDLYMDNGTAAKWLFLETEASSGKYYMTQDGVNYLSSNGAGAELQTVTTPTPASIWTIVSKADRKSALSSATIDVPGDATFLIADANFNRNAIKSVWNGTSKTSDNKTNLNLGGGANDNNCAESYHATFSISQSLTGLATGVYSLTAQGFYRQDGSDNEHLPYFYLGDEKATFPAKTGSENSMTDASNSFAAGSYTIEPIYVRVEDGNLSLGAKLEDENYGLWCIWDNFQLTYYGNVTVAAVKMKASVDAYNVAMTEAQAFTESSMFADDWTALQTAITTNTLDLNDAGLTESQLTTATANLVAAKAAANAAVEQKTKYNTAVTTMGSSTNVDLTSLIGNPSFESTAAYALVAGGWTNEGVGLQGQTNSGFDGYRVGSVFAERWVASGTIGAFKTSQKLTLPEGIYTISVVGTFNGDGASLFVDGVSTPITDAKTYSISVEVSDKQQIEFGLQGVSPTGSWFKADNFTLTYLGTIEDLTYTLATGKMGTDKSAAQSAAETTFLSTKNLANYDALLAAIANAEASKVTYNNLKAAIDKANAILAANNFVTVAATTAFQDEITAATNGWNDVTFTDAGATAEIAALGSAVSGHRGNKDGKAGNYLVSAWNTYTDGETHTWDGYVINTWSTEGDNDGTNFSVPFLEYWVSDTNNLPAKTMTAELTGLPNGMYEVELWARVQRRSDADFNADNSMITMSVNGGEAASIMSNTENNVGSGGNVMRLGRYTARGEVTDGTLTLSINVKLGANVHWLAWRDVTYTKLDEATMEVSDALYATFVAPFAVAVPDNVTAWTIGEPDAKGELDLTDIGKTIPANTPVVLQSTAEIPATTVYGYATPIAEPTNGLLKGVYTDTPAIKGTYVLQKQGEVVGFYKVETAGVTTVKANRAYLNWTDPNAQVKAFILNGGDTDAIKSVFDGIAAGKIYDLSGRKVAKMQKGNTYIVNGKKVNVK